MENPYITQKDGARAGFFVEIGEQII